MATLLLLPGLDGTGMMFRPLLREFGEGAVLRPVTYPQDPGLGYPELADLVRAQLPRGDFFVLGESFSGPIALRIAAGNPQGLRGIILCATFVRNPSPVFPAALAFLLVAPLFRAWPVSVKLHLLASARPSEEVMGLLREVRKTVRSDVLAARTRAALRVNAVEDLARCRYPLLYLCGRRDIVVPGRNLRFMRSVRPDMRAEYLPTSHLVLQEAPREAARLIREFMQDAATRVTQ